MSYVPNSWADHPIFVFNCPTFTYSVKRLPVRTSTVLLISILVVAMAACKKNNGINQNLNPNAQISYDFMSTKIGSYWKYGGRDGVTYTRYARNRDSVVDGFKYSYFERQEDPNASITPEYFGKNDHYYLCLLDLDGTQTSYLKYVYWDENASQGDNWENTGKVNHPLTGDVTMVVKSTLSETNLSMTVSGTTFNNVRHVHSDIKATAFNIGIGTLDIWFVKGIGVLREEAHINVMGAYTNEHTDSLLSYHIVP